MAATPGGRSLQTIDHYRGMRNREDDALGTDCRDLASNRFVLFEPEAQLVVADEAGGEGDPVLEVQYVGLGLRYSQRVAPPVLDGVEHTVEAHVLLAWLVSSTTVYNYTTPLDIVVDARLFPIHIVVGEQIIFPKTLDILSSGR